MSNSNDRELTENGMNLARSNFLKGFGHAMIIGAVLLLIAGLVGAFPEGPHKAEADHFLVGSSVFAFLMGFAGLYQARKIAP